MTSYSTFKPVKILVMALLVVALVAAIVLTKNNQNTQKGAYFSGAKLMILPATITANVNDDVPVQLWVNTDMITGSTEPAKVSSVDATFCYGNGLALNLAVGSTDLATVIDLNQDAFRSIEYVKNQNGCLRIVAVSTGISPGSLKSGAVMVASVRFSAIAAGTGTIALDMGKAVVAGYNPLPGSTDMTMKIGSVENADYTIGATGTITPTGGALQTCQQKCGGLGWCNPAVITAPNCSHALGGGTTAFDSNICVNRVPNGTTYPGSETRDCIGTTTSMCTCYTVSKIDCGSPVTCTSDCKCPGVSPTGTQSLLLKFKMTYLGITPNAECADTAKMPMTVTVMAADGTTKSYENVIPTKTNSGVDLGIGGTLAVYDVSLRLEGFNYADKIAVFVKDGRHLQVKYGVNNQSAFYNKVGGELGTLTSDDTSTPVYDFTKYPLLAGDVTNDNKEIGIQDGKVDGVDFSFIKTMSIGRTLVDPGVYLLSDLNGNCKMESTDLWALMYSLNEKQAQLY